MDSQLKGQMHSMNSNLNAISHKYSRLFQLEEKAKDLWNPQCNNSFIPASWMKTKHAQNKSFIDAKNCVDCNDGIKAVTKNSSSAHESSNISTTNTKPTLSDDEKIKAAIAGLNYKYEIARYKF